MELRERGKGRESDTGTTILQNPTSVKTEDIRICTESC
jgi:hypothetical protein